METLPDLGTVAGIAGVVLIAVQLLKPYLPGDSVIRLVAVGLGIALAWAHLAALAASRGTTIGAMDVLTDFIRGLEGGFTAMGGYQALNSLQVLKSKG